MPAPRSLPAKPSHRARVASALLGAIVAAGAVALLPEPGHGQSKAGKTAAVASAMAASETSFAPMLEKAMPAVVSIRARGATEVEQPALLANPIYSRLLNQDNKSPPTKSFTSNGSGVIIDAAEGIVVTNYHVIESANEITVRLHDGREFVGKLIGQDPAVDVAVVKIKAHRLTSLPLGDALSVRVGDLVFAAGNPLGLESTATLGMVSSLRRTAVGYRNFEAYIQHDASVNSGNSGGALINLKGELIGINTAIISPSGGSVGLGFAIPIQFAKRIWDQLLKYGEVRRGHIGVKTVDTRTELFNTYGLATSQGAFVLDTQPDSPARAANLEFADLIVGVQVQMKAPGQWIRVPIQRSGQLEALIASTELGEELRIEYLRGFEQHTAPMKIAKVKPYMDHLEVPADIVRLAGVVVQPLTSDNPAFGKVRGVEVVDVKKGSLAEIVGLQAGDVMTQIDRDRIRTIEDVVELTKDKAQKFEISIVRNGRPLRVQFPL